MSRCFPFPPPGYEKNAKLDDTDLLKKEKRTEKRHKKDKKDKEKREGKERKEDKERSEGKHKEKKDRKEKHKDRKDKDRDKEKKRTSDQKNIVGPPEGQNGKKLGSNGLQSGDATDTKFLLELGERIRDEGGERENGMFQRSTVTGQKTTELPGSLVEFGNSTEGREKYKEKVDRNVNGKRNKIEARGVENAFIQYFSGMDQKMVGVARPMDRDVKRQTEGEKKHKHKDNDSRGDRHKDRDREKKSKSNDKEKTKEKGKEEKAKEKEPYKEQPVSGKTSKGDNFKNIHNIKPSYTLNEGNKSSTYNGSLGKRKELSMNGFLHDDDIRPNKWPRTISSFHQLVENGRKLGPCQTALQDACEKQVLANHLVDNKVFSGHQILENRRELKPKPSAIQSASERQGATNGSKEDKEARMNGLIKAQQPNVCWNKPLSTPVRLKEKVEASARPPHRDFKYLGQILSVPKVLEWSDFDHQEWLFSSDNLPAENAKAGSSEFSEVDQTLQVWAEALRMESMDVTALPYVIPF